jgi:hypothetical protein
MQQVFFSMIKKIYCLFFLLRFIPLSPSYSELLLSTSLYSEQATQCPKKTYHVYGHHKFCKKISFYYSTEIKKINNNDTLILYLLLIDHEDNEQEIIPENETLLNRLQWHCSLTYNTKKITAKTIFKKEKNQNDIILFGKNHIPFGTLYEITFNLDDYKNQEFLFNITQYDKKYSICLYF